MATSSELIGSLEPGSVPYGERQGLEQNLTAVSGGQAPVVPGAPPAGGGEEKIVSDNPLDPLLQGDVSTGLGPLTSGLSYGPGPGPNQPVDPYEGDPLITNLRALALYAQSPVLRQLARRALRSQVRGSRDIR